MKKILLLAVIAMLASTPSFASYVYGNPVNMTWTDNFEDGNISGWTCTAGTYNVVAEAPQNTAAPINPGGNWAVEQPTGTVTRTDHMSKDVNTITMFDGARILDGYVFGWFYDNMGTAGKDARLGYYSSAGQNASSYMTSINLTTTASTVYYRVQWSSSPVTLDGVTDPITTATADYIVGGKAVRSTGWHRWRIQFAYDWDGGRADVSWYLDDMLTPKASLWYTSGNSRWVNTKNMAKVFIGSPFGHQQTGQWDDISVNATLLTPEPSSLLALGVGLAGLVGLMRRRR